MELFGIILMLSFFAGVLYTCYKIICALFFVHAQSKKLERSGYKFDYLFKMVGDAIGISRQERKIYCTLLNQNIKDIVIINFDDVLKINLAFRFSKNGKEIGEIVLTVRNMPLASYLLTFEPRVAQECYSRLQVELDMQ